MNRRNRKGQLEAMQQTIKFFETLLRASTDGVVLTDTTQKIIVANEAFCAFFEKNRRDVIETSLFTWLEQLDDNASQRWAESEKRVRLQGLSHNIEFKMTMKDEMKHFSVNAYLLERIANGETDTIISIWRDVTKYKKAEEALQIEKSYHKQLFENVPEAIALTTKDGRVLSVNDEFIRLFMYTREEAIGQILDNLVVPKDLTEEGAYLTKRAAEGKRVILDTLRHRKDGTLINVSILGAPIIIGDKQVGVYSIYRDITERKEAEEALRESEEKFRIITTSAKEAIVMIDDEGKVVFWNKEAEKSFGYSNKEILGKVLHKVLAPQKYHEDYKKGIFKFKKYGQGPVIGKTLELAAKKKDGTEIPIELSVSSVRLKNKWNSIGVIRDISERKRVEEAQRDSEKRYRTLIEYQGEGIGIVDAEENFTFANPAAHEIFGVPSDCLVGRNLREFVNADTFAIIRAQTKERKAGKKSIYEIEFNHSDGERRHLLVTATPRFNSEGRFIGSFGIFRDITDLKRTEEALRESIERFRSLFESATEFIHILDKNGRIIQINPAIIAGSGFSENELIGQKLDKFFTPASKQIFREHFPKLLEKGTCRQECEFVCKDGIIITLDCLTSAIYNKEGEIISFVSFQRDISKEKEIAQMKSDFVSHVSHELRSPLASIKGFASTILADKEMNEETRIEFLNIINNESDRLAQLIEDLLDLSKIESGYTLNKQKAQILDIVQEAIFYLKPQSEEKKITIKSMLPQAFPLISCDRDMILQVIMNLLSNAIKFTPEGGRITVSTEEKNEIIKVKVSDTGIGIPEKDLPHIFDKFYRVKRPGEVKRGTGLGLSIAKKIIESHEGSIQAKSEVGKGSTFSFTMQK